MNASRQLREADARLFLQLLNQAKVYGIVR